MIKVARRSMVSSSSTRIIPLSPPPPPSSLSSLSHCPIHSHHRLVRQYSSQLQQHFFFTDYYRPPPPPPQRRRPRRCWYSSTTTATKQDDSRDQLYYYDSQSGLHIPVHNEQEIQLFLDVSKTKDKTENENTTSTSPSSPTGTFPGFVMPHHLYKDGDPGASNIPEQIRELQSNGIYGVILPPIQFPRDVRNLQTLRSLLSTELDPHQTTAFQFFTSPYPGDSLWQEFVQRLSSSTTVWTEGPDPDTKPTIPRVDGFGGMLVGFDYRSFDSQDDSETSIEQSQLLSRCIESNIPTSLSITLDGSTGSSDDDVDDVVAIDPISLSNSVATLLDTHPAGSFSKIFVGKTSSSLTSSQQYDALLSVIEELIYLDVAGPTIKSRLVVHTFGKDNEEDFIEDVMFAGVNKFVVSNVAIEEQKDGGSTIELIRNVAVDQGKEILKNVS